MRKMWVVLAVLAAVPTFAQQDKTTRKPPVKQIVFGEGADIEGGLDHPAVTLIDPRPKAVFPNLIRIRGDFNDKLMASVHEL